MASIGNTTFAAEDPGALAKFWSEAVDYELQEAPPGLLEAIEAEGGDPNAAAAVDPGGRGPRLFFKMMAISEPEHLPIHLDLNCPDRVAEIDRLLDLGATVVETKTETTGPYSETWTVMQDPEGNGFCVQSPPDG